MHSIPILARNLKIGDYFVCNPDQYFFAIRYKVESKDDNELIAVLVYRYPAEPNEKRFNDDSPCRRVKITLEKTDDIIECKTEKEFYDRFYSGDNIGKVVFIEEPIWSAFPDKNKK